MTEFKPLPRSTKRGGYARLGTALYAFAGIVLPVTSFALAARNGNMAADQPWQAGEFWVYATLMLKWPAVLPFYPLLLYSMGSMGLFLWDRKRFAEYFLVRIGLYGGVILALIFAWLLYAPIDRALRAVIKTAAVVVVIDTVTGVAFIFLLLFAIVLNLLFGPTLKRWGWKGATVRLVAVALLLLGIVFLVADKPLEWLAAPFFIVFVVSLAASPAWTFAAYLSASAHVVRERSGLPRQWSLKTLLGFSTWIACLFGAWRRAMDLAIQEYAALPTDDPNCFICAAAARGRRGFVRSEIICTGNGEAFVNQQLRTLKAAELALKTATPRLHRLARRTYNRVGPPLACRVRSPLAADAVYILLKPIEWTARLGLAMLGVRRDQIARLYASTSRR